MLHFFDFIKSEKKISNMIYIPVCSLKLFYHMYLYIQIYCKPTFICMNISCHEPALFVHVYYKLV